MSGPPPRITHAQMQSVRRVLKTAATIAEVEIARRRLLASAASRRSDPDEEAIQMRIVRKMEAHCDEANTLADLIAGRMEPRK